MRYTDKSKHAHDKWGSRQTIKRAYPSKPHESRMTVLMKALLAHDGIVTFCGSDIMLVTAL
jgi:hypothetical protein